MPMMVIKSHICAVLERALWHDGDYLTRTNAHVLFHYLHLSISHGIANASMNYYIIFSFKKITISLSLALVLALVRAVFLSLALSHNCAFAVSV